MKKGWIIIAIFIVLLCCFINFSLNSSSTSNNIKGTSVGTTTVQNKKTGETMEVNTGTYLAAKQAYSDVLVKYNTYKDLYDCVKFYKSIGADINLNDEYRDAANKLPQAKSDYETAYNAFKSTFPEFADAW